MLPEQEGAYFRLLCHAWSDEDCSLPKDEQKLAILSRLCRRWKKLRADIVECFEPHPTRPDRLINRRLWDVRQSQNEHSERRRNAGAKGNERRWNVDRNATPKRSQCDRNAISERSQWDEISIANGSQNDRSPSPSSSSLKEKKEKNKNPPQVPLTTEGFKDFWEAYPRKVGKPATLKAWRAAHLGAADLVSVLAAIARHRLTEQWRQSQFIPYPATWLNQRRWEDEPEPPDDPYPLRLTYRDCVVCGGSHRVRPNPEVCPGVVKREGT